MSGRLHRAQQTRTCARGWSGSGSACSSIASDQGSLEEGFALEATLAERATRGRSGRGAHGDGGRTLRGCM